VGKFMLEYFNQSNDMRKTADPQHIPILTGLNTMARDRGWDVEALPLVVGQRSVKEKEWLEYLKIFRISTEDLKKSSTTKHCSLSMRPLSSILSTRLERGPAISYGMNTYVIRSYRTRFTNPVVNRG